MGGDASFGAAGRGWGPQCCVPPPHPTPHPLSSAENTETGVKVAIKKISNVFGKDADIVDAKRILREIRLMRHFHHENVRGVAGCNDVLHMGARPESVGPHRHFRRQLQ